MKNFVKRMVEEHSELVARIDKLQNYVYGPESDKDDKIEFANKAIQLGAMKKYEEALRARLENQNIVIDGLSPNLEYFEKVASLTLVDVEMPEAGNDYDIDKESQTPTDNN